jgi:hypothetical protein
MTTPKDGVVVVHPWEVKVHCSKGERTLRAGMRWRDGLHGSTWEVVEPEGGRIYSPSGLGGTPTFWCRPVGVLPAGAEHLLDGHREDGCVSFCGDSIAAGLIEPHGVGEVQPLRQPANFKCMHCGWVGYVEGSEPTCPECSGGVGGNDAA